MAAVVGLDESLTINMLTVDPRWLGFPIIEHGLRAESVGYIRPSDLTSS